MSSKTMAVFLDRDGVLNKTVVRNGCPFPPQSLSEITILPGVKEACLRLIEAGFVLIGVTNQPDIARGTAAPESVFAINDYLQNELGIHEFFICPHDNLNHCACRKPEPGLLLKAAEEWDIDLAASFMVGDRWRDIEAGHRAGCRTAFIDYEYLERRPELMDITVASLTEAVDWILAPSTKELICHV